MGNSSPLISILMPVYNAEQYLRQAVASIQSQSLADFELIAIDDGSADRSRGILEDIARTEPRLKVLSRPNTGIVGALNDGLAIARAGFIARMDADDIALPSRLASQLSFLQAQPDCIVLGTAVQIVDSRGAVVDFYRPPQEHDGILQQLLVGNGGAIIHPSVVFRAGPLRAVGGYDPAFCKAEDLDLFLRLSRVGRLANQPEIGLQYRHHAKSTNFKHRETQLKLVEQILSRERALRNLPPLAQRPTGHSDVSKGRLHANWACTALTYGRRSTALRHGLLGVINQPSDAQCWRSLRYVLSAKRPSAP